MVDEEIQKELKYLKEQINDLRDVIVELFEAVFGSDDDNYHGQLTEKEKDLIGMDLPHYKYQDN